MSLSLTWGEPMAQGSGVVGYSVEALRVQHRQSSRQLESVSLMPAYNEEVNGTQARVIQGLGKNTANILVVKYSVSSYHNCIMYNSVIETCIELITTASELLFTF